MIELISWGFKYGRPPANFYFDVSYLVNPWRKKELQGASKETIINFMKKQKEFEELINVFVNLICVYERLWPKETLIFAFCCSAGEYRSPVVIEEISTRLKRKNIIHKIIKNNNSKI